jgi:hypothetical protein
VTSDRVCNGCGAPLVLGENWTESRQHRADYRCKPCYSLFVNNPKRNLAYELVGGAKAYYALLKEERLALRRRADEMLRGVKLPTAPRKPPTEVTPELAAMRDRLKAIYRESDNKQSGMKDGFVYVITHPDKRGWVSVGQSSDPVRRLTSYQRACPHRRFKLTHYAYFTDRRKAEREVHRKLRKAGLKMKREWVEAPVERVIHFVQEVQRTSDVRSTNDPGVRS